MKDTLRLAQEEERQLKGDIHAQSSVVEAAEQAVDVRSKVLADLKTVSTLSPDDAKELERHEQVMLALQSSLSPDTWTTTDVSVILFCFLFLFYSL